VDAPGLVLPRRQGLREAEDHDERDHEMQRDQRAGARSVGKPRRPDHRHGEGGGAQVRPVLTRTRAVTFEQPHGCPTGESPHQSCHADIRRPDDPVPDLDLDVDVDSRQSDEGPGSQRGSRSQCRCDEAATSATSHVLSSLTVKAVRSATPRRLACTSSRLDALRGRARSASRRRSASSSSSRCRWRAISM
jgi:hypothetical protein